MNYKPEYLEDGTLVIANQVIQGGIKHDIAKSNLVIRGSTFRNISPGESAIEIIDSKYPLLLTWAKTPFAWLGWWRIVAWLNSWHKPRYAATISDNVFLGEP